MKMTVGNIRELLEGFNDDLILEIEPRGGSVIKDAFLSVYFDGVGVAVLSQYPEPIEEEPEPVAPDDGDLLDASYINRVRD